MLALHTSNVRGRRTFLVIRCPLCHNEELVEATDMSLERRAELARGSWGLERIIDGIMEFLGGKSGVRNSKDH